MGGNYKSGTYKGLDLTFGIPDRSIGGILIRSLMPVSVEKDGDVIKVIGGSKDTFIEGPCNCVNKILQETCGKDIKDLVAMAEFKLDAFY